MSASWHSEPVRRPGARAGVHVVLAALLGLALTLAVTEARSQSSSSADSGGHVRRLRVSNRGIVVVRGADLDSTIERVGERIRRRVHDRVNARIHADSGLIEVQTDGTGLVRIWSDAYVPAGQTVDGDVVAVFGSVTVEGAVTRDVVAVFGSVHLKSGARVDGDVVSVGGRLDQADGVTVKGETVQLGFTPFTMGLPARSVLIIAVAAGWLVSLFTGWIFSLLLPAGMLRVATVVERRPAASFFLGILSLPMFLVALVLLCITVIGIPLAILLPMVYMLMGYVGQLAATTVLGARLARRSLAGGLMAPLLVGTLFVAALLVVGIALMAGGGVAQPVSLFLLLSGGLLLLGLGSLGTGACLLSRFGTRPREVVWHGHAPMATGAGPVPGTVPPPATS